jgi:hypothetical protein
MFAKLLAPLRSLGLKKTAKILLLFLVPSLIVGILDEFFGRSFGILNILADLSLGACLVSLGFLLLVDRDYEIAPWFSNKKSTSRRILRGLAVMALGFLALASVFFSAT